MNNKYLIVVAICLSFQVFSYELDAYKKPIPFYDYVTNLEKLLLKSVQRNRWTLVKDENNNFHANILHKTYDIKTALVIENKTVSIKLLSVTRVGCKGRCKVKDDKVQGWLLRLRKSLAYDITLAVKKETLKKSLQD